MGFKKLQSIIGKVNKKFNTRLTPADSDDRISINFRVDTGIPQLNVMLGGGYPAGRVVELTGEESAGKSTVIQYGISSNPGGSVLSDPEGAFDENRVEQMGLDTSRLIYDDAAGGTTAEKVFDSYFQLMQEYGESTEEEPLMLFLDSLAALQTEQDSEKKLSDAVVASLARVASRGFRKLGQQLVDKNVAFVVVNQLRMKVGASKYEDAEVSPGGRALKFYASTRLRLKAVKKLYKKHSVRVYTEGERKTTPRGVREAEGILVRVKSIKNKVFKPFLEAEFNIYFDSRGIDWKEGFINFLLRYKVINTVDRKPGLYILNPVLADEDLYSNIMEDGEPFDQELLDDLLGDAECVKEVERLAIKAISHTDIAELEGESEAEDIEEGEDEE